MQGGTIGRDKDLHRDPSHMFIPMDRGFIGMHITASGVVSTPLHILYGATMTEKTLDQLLEEQSEMLASAHDQGIEVPEELSAEITEAAAGSSLVSALDAHIREHSDGESAASKSPAKKKTTAKKKAAAPKKETTKVTTKKAAPAKKAVAKKAATAKKAVAATTKAKPPGKRVQVTEEGKIVWLGKDNPAREGSGRHERIENIKKHNGKTVKAYLAAKGREQSLKWCVRKGLAKVA